MTTQNELSRFKPHNAIAEISGFPEVNYYVSKHNIPGTTIGVTVIPQKFGKALLIPGTSSEPEPLTFTFQVDEELNNFIKLLQWQEETVKMGKLDRGNYKEIVKPITITTLNNNQKPVKKFTYHDCWCFSLSALECDVASTDNTTFVTASFHFTEFEILDKTI